MSPSKPPDRENRLLATLSTLGKRRFLANCDRVELDLGEVLCESGERIRYVYFPLDGFISVVTKLEDDSRLEVGIVGSEGMLGTSMILGVETYAQHAVVQGSGAALRMSVATFRQHCGQSEALRQRLNRYVYVLMSQLALTAACTHYHLIEARLARWLLMGRDRAHSDQYRLTHEFMADMLGVRRAGITLAAGALQARSLIEYSRGEVCIRDGAGLEKASCRCYREANRMYDRTLAVHRRRVSVGRQASHAI